MSVVHFILVDFNFGWWMTILGMMGDHPGDGGLTIHGTSPGLNFVS